MPVGQEEVDIVLKTVVLVVENAVAVDDHSGGVGVSLILGVNNIAAAIEIDGSVNVEGILVLDVIAEQVGNIGGVLQPRLLVLLVSEGDVRISLAGLGVQGLLTNDGSELLEVGHVVDHLDRGEDIALNEILVTIDFGILVDLAVDLNAGTLDHVVSIHHADLGVDHDNGVDIAVAVDIIESLLSALGVESANNFLLSAANKVDVVSLDLSTVQEILHAVVLGGDEVSLVLGGPIGVPALILGGEQGVT